MFYEVEFLRKPYLNYQLGKCWGIHRVSMPYLYNLFSERSLPKQLYCKIFCSRSTFPQMSVSFLIITKFSQRENTNCFCTQKNININIFIYLYIYIYKYIFNKYVFIYSYINIFIFNIYLYIYTFI